MRISVDLTTCQNMGQCVYEAPSVFSLDAAGHLQFVEGVSEDRREEVESAANLCPTQSISIE